MLWESLAVDSEYRLQKNIVFGNCRIFRNADDVRIDFEKENIMRAKFEQITGRMISRAVRGDVILVHWFCGIYNHYEDYENNQCIHFE